MMLNCHAVPDVQHFVLIFEEEATELGLHFNYVIKRQYMCAFKEILHSDPSPLNQSAEDMWKGFRQGVCSATEEVIPPSTHAKK